MVLNMPVNINNMDYITKSGEFITIKEVCFNCAFFDTTLDIRFGYRCHCGSCPDFKLDENEKLYLLKVYHANKNTKS